LREKGGWVGVGLRESFPAGVESSHPRCYHLGIAPDFRQPNGRFLVRMPVSLHKQASLAAASEGVSLNQFVCGLLASAIEWDGRLGERAPRERRYPSTNEELSDQLWRDLLG
jgi:hypothetical protein